MCRLEVIYIYLKRSLCSHLRHMHCSGVQQSEIITVANERNKQKNQSLGIFCCWTDAKTQKNISKLGENAFKRREEHN